MAEISYNAITELLSMIDLREAASKLSNKQLAIILIEQVWADLPIDTAASALIAEVADRLETLPATVVQRQHAHIDSYIEQLRQDRESFLQRARTAERTIRIMREQLERLEDQLSNQSERNEA